MSGSSRAKILFFFVGLLFCVFFGILLAPYVTDDIYGTIAALAALEGFGKIEIVQKTPQTIMAVSVIYLIIYLGMANTIKPARTGEEHGSAKWQNAKDVNRAVSSKEFCKNRILSANLKIAVIGKSPLPSVNSFCVGGMGQGKSYYFVIPNILQAASSMVITDPSGELAARTGDFLKEKGIKVKVVDIEKLSSSLRYNFFRYIKSEEDILAIADTIFDATVENEKEGSKDPMWDNLAKDRLVAYIVLLWLSGDIKDRNMDTLLWLFEQDVTIENKDGSRQENAVSMMFDDLEMCYPGNIATSKYLSSTRGAAVTVRGVDSSLSGRLGRFMLPEVRSMMQTDELALEMIGKEKTALFLVVPAENKSLNFLVSMIYAQLFRVLYEQARRENDKRLAVPVQFYLDEMANIVLPKDFPTYLTTGRKHGISFVGILQDLAQAEKIFSGKVYETVIGTSSSFLYLGGSGKHTDEYISKWIGTQTILTQTQSVSYGMRGSSSKSLQPTARDLIKPEELGALPLSKCIVYVQGKGWVMDNKYNPKTHPGYKECADVTGRYYDWRRQNEAAQIEVIPHHVGAAIEINLDEISLSSLAQKYDLFWED